MYGVKLPVDRISECEVVIAEQRVATPDAGLRSINDPLNLFRISRDEPVDV